MGLLFFPLDLTDNPWIGVGTGVLEFREVRTGGVLRGFVKSAASSSRDGALDLRPEDVILLGDATLANLVDLAVGVMAPDMDRFLPNELTGSFPSLLRS